MGIDTTKLRSVHFVGIKGVAMTALAIYCKEKGLTVTGSDVEEEFPTQASLEKNHIQSLIGFSPDHIDTAHKPDLVIFTGAHGGRDNVEVQTARNLGIETMPHGRALGFFMDGSVQISVAGSHGKTTTTAMIATILETAGRHPSYAVGCGDIRGIGFPGHFGKGRVFVSEADEYVTDPTHDRTPRFLWQHPDILVVTNIDYDHPDAYPNLEAVQEAFLHLQKQQEGIRVSVVNADDPKSTVLLKSPTSKILTYGFSENADCHPKDVNIEEGKTTFTCMFQGNNVGTFTLSIPGRFNVTNACAALTATQSLGVSWEDIKTGLLNFGGTKRRFELVGKVNGIRVYDDYAHHPHEIEATLAGARGWFPKNRIIAIFQPHTFSRTKALLSEFSICFKDSDIVCIADIYASAREHETLGMTSRILVNEIEKHHKNVQYVQDLDGVLSFLQKNKKEGDVILCMGAGDIAEWGGRIVNEL